jgi:hypothetical protein
MRAFATAVANAAPLIGALTLGAHAQTLPDPHQVAFALSADVGPYPDAFTVRCGTAPNSPDDGAPIGLGAGMSVIDRPRSMVFVEADLRASAYRGSACADNPGTLGGTSFDPAAGTPGMPLLRTILHAGIETPPSFPLVLRATVGAGMIWDEHTAPVESMTIGAGSNNPGPRFFTELERDVSRARMTVTTTELRSTGATTSVTSEVAHPAWMALRIGVEWPLR